MAWQDSVRVKMVDLEVLTEKGKVYKADIVIMAIGVKPET